MSYRPSHRNLLAARDAIRSALAALDDTAVAALYDRAARLAGRDGFPANTDSGGGRGGGSSSTTEAAALAGYSDSDDAANIRTALADPTGDLLRELWALVTGPMLTSAHRVTDLTNAIATVAPTGRVSSVDLCAECGQPCPDCHRVDGQPYCATSCYHRVRRRRLRLDGVITEDDR